MGRWITASKPFHTAADDYEELTEILEEKPPPVISEVVDRKKRNLSLFSSKTADLEVGDPDYPTDDMDTSDDGVETLPPHNEQMAFEAIDVHEGYTGTVYRGVDTAENEAKSRRIEFDPANPFINTSGPGIYVSTDKDRASEFNQGYLMQGTINPSARFISESDFWDMRGEDYSMTPAEWAKKNGYDGVVCDMDGHPDLVLVTPKAVTWGESTHKTSAYEGSCPGANEDAVRTRIITPGGKEMFPASCAVCGKELSYQRGTMHPTAHKPAGAQYHVRLVNRMMDDGLPADHPLVALHEDWVGKLTPGSHTASWSDVQAKAKRIRSEGGVRILAADDTHIAGHVLGDSGTYETEFQFNPGTHQIGLWQCSCPWAAYSWGRSGPWKKYEGRMCAHALALSYQAQSEGMFGGHISEQPQSPGWDKEITRYTPPPQKDWRVGHKYYHVAPTYARESIEREGLTPTGGNFWHLPEDQRGVYLFGYQDDEDEGLGWESAEQHGEWLKGKGKLNSYDIWEVDIPNSAVKQDPTPFVSIEDQWVTHEPIPPSKIKRVASGQVTPEDVREACKDRQAFDLLGEIFNAPSGHNGPTYGGCRVVAEALKLIWPDAKMKAIIADRGDSEEIKEFYRTHQPMVQHYVVEHNGQYVDGNGAHNAHELAVDEEYGGFEEIPNLIIDATPALIEGNRGIMCPPGAAQKFADYIRNYGKPIDLSPYKLSMDQKFATIMQEFGSMNTLDDKFIEIVSSMVKEAAYDGPGMMIALRPPDEICEKLVLEDGEPFEELHYTLVYIKDRSAVDMDKLREIVLAESMLYPTLTGEIQGYGQFHNADEDVFWAGLSSHDVPAFRAALCEALDRNGIAYSNDHPYTPHMTLKYYPGPIGEIPPFPDDAKGEFKFSDIIISTGDEWEFYALGGITIDDGREFASDFKVIASEEDPMPWDDNDQMETDTNPEGYQDVDKGGVQADLHSEPEPALPSTDGDQDLDTTWEMDDDDAEAGGTEHTTLEASRSWLMDGSGGPKGDLDIAAGAREFLQKAALKDFTFSEQQELINESPNVIARNFDRLEIGDTHYAGLEEAILAAEAEGEDVIWW